MIDKKEGSWPSYMDNGYGDSLSKPSFHI